MAETKITPPVSNQFTSLPLELREQIWREALPTVSGPALFTYRKGCWIVRDPTKGETGYEPGFPDHLELLFLHESLRKLYFDVPIFFVNSEAREIATAWFRQQGFDNKAFPGSVSLYEQSGCTLGRTFRPDRDILYVPSGELVYFHNEPMDCIWSHYNDRSYNTTCEASRLAVSRGSLVNSEILGDLIALCNYRIEELFIILDPQPEQPSEESNDSVLPRWELDIPDYGSYKWTNDSWEIAVENRQPADSSLHEYIESMILRSDEEFRLSDYASEFTIRVVRATQR